MMSPVRLRMHLRISNQHPRASLCFKGFKTFCNPSSWSQPFSCNKLEEKQSPYLLSHHSHLTSLEKQVHVRRTALQIMSTQNLNAYNVCGPIMKTFNSTDNWAIGSDWGWSHPVSNQYKSLKLSFQVSESKYRCKFYKSLEKRFSYSLNNHIIAWVLSIVLFSADPRMMFMMF